MGYPEPHASDHVLRSDPECSLAEIHLSARELRGIHFLQRFPWVTPVTVALVWIIFFGSLWYQLRIILEHGADFGLSTPSDVWQLTVSWSETKRLFHPYEVFVIHEVTTAFWKGALLLLLTCLVAASSFQNRLVLKLWRALQARRSR